MARLRGDAGRVARPRASEERESGRSGYVARPEDLVAHVRTLADTGDATGRHRRAMPPRRGWARLPAAFVGARWQPGRRAVAGVVGVAVLAVLVFGVRLAWARSSASPDVLVPGGGARAGPTGVSAGAAPVGLDSGTVGPGGPLPTAGPAVTPAGADGTGGVPGGPAEVVVHVVGEVREPGVQRLPSGSRVLDAVDAAGGATRRADLGAVNLARVLLDGEQVRVPAPGEAPAPVRAPGGAEAGAGGSATTGVPVSLNTADLAALDTLPGVGPVLAQRIVDWRTVHGRFTSVDELTEVSGIGEKLLEQLRPLVST
jgi:competence protein ComEA